MLPTVQVAPPTCLSQDARRREYCKKHGDATLSSHCHFSMCPSCQASHSLPQWLTASLSSNEPELETARRSRLDGAPLPRRRFWPPSRTSLLALFLYITLLEFLTTVPVSSIRAHHQTTSPLPGSLAYREALPQCTLNDSSSPIFAALVPNQHPFTWTKGSLPLSEPTARARRR